jgi:hypothetical protein
MELGAQARALFHISAPKRSRSAGRRSMPHALRATLLKALTDHSGNLTLATQAVGYSRETFVSVLRRFGIGEVIWGWRKKGEKRVHCAADFDGGNEPPGP